MWSNPSERAAVDCGKTDQGDVREEVWDLWWEMPVEESWAAMEARRYTAESRIAGKPGGLPSMGSHRVRHD